MCSLQFPLDYCCCRWTHATVRPHRSRTCPRKTWRLSNIPRSSTRRLMWVNIGIIHYLLFIIPCSLFIIHSGLFWEFRRFAIFASAMATLHLLQGLEEGSRCGLAEQSVCDWNTSSSAGLCLCFDIAPPWACKSLVNYLWSPNLGCLVHSHNIEICLWEVYRE